MHAVNCLTAFAHGIIFKVEKENFNLCFLKIYLGGRRFFFQDLVIVGQIKITKLDLEIKKV